MKLIKRCPICDGDMELQDDLTFLCTTCHAHQPLERVHTERFPPSDW